MAKTVKIEDLLNHPFAEDREFNDAFNSFLDMRKSIKKPATPRAIELLLNKVIKLSNGKLETAIAIIDRSNINNWQDLYALPVDTFVMGQQPSRNRQEER